MNDSDYPLVIVLTCAVAVSVGFTIRVLWQGFREHRKQRLQRKMGRNRS